MSVPMLRSQVSHLSKRSFYPRHIPRKLPVNTGIKFVPQQQAWVVDRFGKFSRILEPGLAILIPFVETIRYVKTLKEVAVEIPSQSAITQGMCFL